MKASVRKLLKEARTTIYDDGVFSSDQIALLERMLFLIEDAIDELNIEDQE